ncbi:MAG TPA: hypothetical protein VKE88_02875, partial [Candidatus Nanoarchaeia archaeon]|nr:hypothetical protein [Candidatus Nanoarchaeia archaeon]
MVGAVESQRKFARDSRKGYCLVSQQIRDAIKKGDIYTGFSNLRTELKNGKERFVDKDLEGKIQAASFEPSIDDELFIVDTKKSGLIRPRPNQTVRQVLKESGALQERINSYGYEVKKGYSYAIRLRDRLTPRIGGFTKASPKSSSGRLFFDARHTANH